jgi:hypothetical protein
MFCKTLDTYSPSIARGNNPIEGKGGYCSTGREAMTYIHAATRKRKGKKCTNVGRNLDI